MNMSGQTPASGPLAALRTLGVRMLGAGTGRFAPRVVRRLKILNGMAYLIVFFSLVYAASYAAADFQTYRMFIWLNLALAVMGLLVPFMHRIHELAGGMLIAVTELAALFAITAMLGRHSGVQLNLIVGAAAPFFIFGLQRKLMIGAVVLVSLALHIAAWFLFPPQAALIAADPALIDQLYLSSAVTTFAVIAALVYYSFSLTERAEAANDALLRNILPGNVVDRLTERPDAPISDSFREVTILFTDLVGFVGIAQRLGAARTVELLNAMVRAFDALALKHGVEKIKTIGDAYMAAAGVPEPSVDQALRMVRFAREMQDALQQTAARFGVDLAMRIGIATGPVMAGVIGTQKFSYDLWGDAVNLAARLESSGRAGEIHICPRTCECVTAFYGAKPRGQFEIKGFGIVETYELGAAHAAGAPRADEYAGNRGPS